LKSKTWFWLVLLLVVPTALLWAGGNYENYDEYLASLYRDTVPVIEPEEAGVRIASESDTVVLDVRSDPERSVSFIAGSEFFNFEDFDLELFLSLSRDTPVILYCAVGYRSERIGEKFISAGFTDVVHVYGGIIEWRNRGLPLEPGSASDGGEGNGTGSDTGDATDPDPPVHGREPKWGRWVDDGNVTYDPPAR